MGRIKDKGEEIKKKLDLKDYNKDMGCIPQGTEVQVDPRSMQRVAIFNSMPAKQQAVKKKVTFYLDQDTESKLNEVFSRKLMKNEKVDKSSLISKAINLLWKEDKEYEL